MQKVFILFTLFVNMLQADEGELLFQGNCVTCHHKTRSISAPSMKEVKAVYLSAFIEKKDFVHYMSEWVLQPNKGSAMMNEAVKKYSLMPQLAFEKDVLNEIATYIYQTDFK
jgi:cytochrome c551/c552